MSTATYRVVIPAAGAGKRMGADRNKLMLELRERPIIAWTLDVFEADPACTEIVLAINPLEQDWFILAVPIKDTVKRIEANQISETVPREQLMAAQTPQAFDLATIRTVHEKAATKYLGTDDASLIEWDGGKVTIVTGHYENIKMTTPDDLWFGEAILMKRGK